MPAGDDGNSEGLVMGRLVPSISLSPREAFCIPSEVDRSIVPAPGAISACSPSPCPARLVDWRLAPPRDHDHPIARWAGVSRACGGHAGRFRLVGQNAVQGLSACARRSCVSAEDFEPRCLARPPRCKDTEDDSGPVRRA